MTTIRILEGCYRVGGVPKHVPNVGLLSWEFYPSSRKDSSVAYSQVSGSQDSGGD